ncbi:MAG: energy transducer TonB [Aureispira sp.]|nr:energy transducer TonB [Aureispira sp.]
MFRYFKLMALILLLGTQCLFAQVDTTIYNIVEEMPYWNVCRELKSSTERRNCANDSLRLFIHENIRYPEVARANEISGTCLIEFIVMEDGTVSKPIVLRSVSDDCDKEVLRVLDSLITYNPFVAAKHKGKAVKCRYKLSVKFSLGNDRVLSRRRSTPPFAVDSVLLQQTNLETLQRYILRPSGFNSGKFRNQGNSSKQITLDVGTYEELNAYILQPKNKGLLKLEATNNVWNMQFNPQNDRILLIKRQNNITYISYQTISEKTLQKSMVLNFSELTPDVLRSIVDQLP